MAYAVQHYMSDAIILYAEHLKKYISKKFHYKVFVANNTLHLDYSGIKAEEKHKVLQEFGIHTKKNIICIGRIQKRKRIENLVDAHNIMRREDIGLILIGTDPEGILKKIEGKNIFKLGPIYDDRKFDLLSPSDVYCLPGAVGLSIVDAFYCGLPFVTEKGDESPEIMYLRHNVNGFFVERGNAIELSEKLLLLIDNDKLRNEFSNRAKDEIAKNGNVEKMVEGFKAALAYVA